MAKVSDEQCRSNYEGVVRLFNEAIPDAGRFEVVYGSGMDVGITLNLGFVRRTTSTFSSYAIGYDGGANEIVLLPIAQDLSAAGEPISLKKPEIKKAKLSFIGKEITIYAKFLPKKYIQFSVEESINNDPDNIVVCVKQDEEAKRFIAFFKDSYSTK